MSGNDEGKGTVRIINFQGQTGYDAPLKTQQSTYVPGRSDVDARITYTISYPTPGAMEGSPTELLADFPEVAQKMTIDHIESQKKR